MAVFSQNNFTVIVSYCQHQLDKIANYMGKLSDKALGEVLESQFTDACKSYDCPKMNQAVEQYFCTVTGKASSNEALDFFVAKFPELNIDILSADSEEEKVLLIDKYSNEMLNIINRGML